MKTLLISIKPIYSQAILAGEKTVEFRRVFGDAAAQADRVIIYESSPTMRIVGSFGIEKIDPGFVEWLGEDMTNRPFVIWGNYEGWNRMGQGCKSGIDRVEFMDYMRGAKSPAAIYIKDVIRYEIPIDPRQIDPKFCPPQSYRWMPESLADVCEKAEWGNMAAIAARGGAFQ